MVKKLLDFFVVGVVVVVSLWVKFEAPFNLSEKPDRYQTSLPLPTIIPLTETIKYLDGFPGSAIASKYSMQSDETLGG